MTAHDGARGDARKRHDAHPDPAIAALIRKHEAAAWDAGYTHCFDCDPDGGAVSLADNPYREDES
ncbi:MAG TPA: hypothetical protein VFJ14_06810 [Nocardioidaceae bacterium]|nr:hypothetical protein [Nocardioidaceae bacterium]